MMVDPDILRWSYANMMYAVCSMISVTSPLRSSSVWNRTTLVLASGPLYKHDRQFPLVCGSASLIYALNWTWQSEFYVLRETFSKLGYLRLPSLSHYLTLLPYSLSKINVSNEFWGCLSVPKFCSSNFLKNHKISYNNGDWSNHLHVCFKMDRYSLRVLHFHPLTNICTKLQLGTCW